MKTLIVLLIAILSADAYANQHKFPTPNPGNGRDGPPEFFTVRQVCEWTCGTTTVTWWLQRPDSTCAAEQPPFVTLHCPTVSYLPPPIVGPGPPIPQQPGPTRIGRYPR